MPSHPGAAHSRTVRAESIDSWLLFRVETKAVRCYRRQIGAGLYFTDQDRSESISGLMSVTFVAPSQVHITRRPSLRFAVDQKQYELGIQSMFPNPHGLFPTGITRLSMSQERGVRIMRIHCIDVRSQQRMEPRYVVKFERMPSSVPSVWIFVLFSFALSSLKARSQPVPHIGSRDEVGKKVRV